MILFYFFPALDNHVADFPFQKEVVLSSGWNAAAVSASLGSLSVAACMTYSTVAKLFLHFLLKVKNTNRVRHFKAFVAQKYLEMIR